MEAKFAMKMVPSSVCRTSVCAAPVGTHGFRSANCRPNGHYVNPLPGYSKDLALALTGRMDDHFTALWDHDHIKFRSKRTLSMLLEEAGFVSVCFELIGRVRPLTESMIAIARNP